MDKHCIKSEKTNRKFKRAMQQAAIMILWGIAYASPALSSSYANEHRMSISVKEGTFYDVVKQIEKQSDFLFFYKNEEINDARRVSLVAKNKSLFEILDELLKDQGLGYRIIDRHVIITKAPPSVKQQGVPISGTVVDVNGEPIAGANVVEKGVSNGTVTDKDGKFALSVSANATLQISYIGYIAQEISDLSQVGGGGVNLL
jgi:hypothetical protein